MAMLNLAIAVDVNRQKESIVETNSGEVLVAPRWPQDCEAQVVSYRRGNRTCRIVYLGTLAQDIGEALTLIDQAGLLQRSKPDWYLRLRDCSDAEK